MTCVAIFARGFIRGDYTVLYEAEWNEEATVAQHCEAVRHFAHQHGPAVLAAVEQTLDSHEAREALADPEATVFLVRS